MSVNATSRSALTLVIDASALVELVAQTRRAPGLEAASSGMRLIAPDLVDIEVLSTLRAWLIRGVIDEDRARRAVERLRASAVERVSAGRFIATTWRLRDNLTAYDASYVALARLEACPLLTLDRRIAGAPGLGVQVILPGPPG